MSATPAAMDNPKRTADPEEVAPTASESPRALLNRLGIQPSKARGQNFLHDPAIVRRIVGAAKLRPDDLVVEVGPGLGALTGQLAERAGGVIAVELDARLAAYLRQQFQGKCVEVIEGDILRIDLTHLTAGRPYKVVANLPYSVAAAVIEHLLESEARPTRLVVMVQREVAERIVAVPPKMSILAVAVRFFGEPRIAFRIGPGAFTPAPRVDSAVLTIDVAARPPLDREDREIFFRLVRAGFNQRRKHLANALAAGIDLPKQGVEARLRSSGIDPDRRAETLSVTEWLRLFRAFQEGADAQD